MEDTLNKSSLAQIPKNKYTKSETPVLGSNDLFKIVTVHCLK